MRNKYVITGIDNRGSFRRKTAFGLIAVWDALDSFIKSDSEAGTNCIYTVFDGSGREVFQVG